MKLVSRPLLGVGSHGACVLFACTALAQFAFAQVGPDGIDWATVGSPGNRGYDGPDPNGRVTGRGSVPYEFKIGRTEVTTAQWMEFYNTFYARPDPVPFSTLPTPSITSFAVDPTYTGPGTRFRLRPEVPNAGMTPSGGITWRVGAMFCNWLCNNKSSDLSALQNGAYDVSTFGNPTPQTFTDQPTHNPGARYWIPTLDEWLKSVHYDPNGNGPGTDRWWLGPLGRDTLPVYGPPPAFGGDGSAEANSGFSLPGMAQYQIPLGSYPLATTPWGLQDAAGGTAEWTEGILNTGDFIGMVRQNDGSPWLGGGAADLAYAISGDRPGTRSIFVGLRIASQVPTPGTLSLVAFVLYSSRWACRNRRSVACSSGLSSLPAGWHRGRPGSCHRSRRLGDDFDAPELLVMLLSRG